MVWATNLSNICSRNLPKVGIYWTFTSESCPAVEYLWNYYWFILHLLTFQTPIYGIIIKNVKSIGMLTLTRLFLNADCEIPKEKYKNIFKGSYERPENMFQRIKQEK
jgi:hypothetical protein